MGERNLRVESLNNRNSRRISSSSSDFGDDDLDEDFLALVESSSKPAMEPVQEPDTTSKKQGNSPTA